MRILLIDIDTLRPDHMSCYGYGRETTPNIDRIAKEGVMFNRYFCSDAPCLPSRAALISGMFGIHNGAVGHGGTCADRRLYGVDRGFKDPIDEHNFINVFRKSGLYTVSISTFAERHSSWWFNAGFNETHNVGKGGMESGEEVLPVALDWLRQNKDRENWFLHLHFWDPHTPYRAPAEFGNPFKNQPLDTWITEDIFRDHLTHVGPHGLNEINMFDDNENPNYPRHPGKITKYNQLRRMIDGYDCGINYTDQLLGQVFETLKNQNIYDDVVIIITSDHGENMGEWGIYGEHATADYATCHIPMIVKWPGGSENYIDNGLHYQIDLVPTMADLLNTPKYEKWDGKSFAGTIRNRENTGRNSLVISQMAHVCQRSAIFDHWLYVRTYHDGYHLFDDEMLFDLEEDRYEQRDIKDMYPEICFKGAKIILDWHDSMMKNSDCEVDPLWTVMHEGGPFHARGQLENYLIRLENTGRGEGASRLREKYKITD